MALCSAYMLTFHQKSGSVCL